MIMPNMLDPYTNEKEAVQECIEQEEENRRRIVVPREGNKWIDGISAGLMSGGATGVAWRAAQNIGTYLGYESSNLYNRLLPTENMIPVGALFFVLGAFLYDSWYYAGDNTQRIIERVIGYFKSAED
jgi:hypothetical protein